MIGPLCGPDCIHDLMNAVETEMYEEEVRERSAASATQPPE